MPLLKDQQDYRVVYCTIATQEQAQKLADSLLQVKLVACVNILPGLLSMYHWQGQIHKDPEVLMVMKTHVRCLEQLERLVQEQHPYEVPELIACNISEGAETYLKWIGESVT